MNQLSTGSLSDKDLKDFKQVVNIFVQAWKNYGLYPEDHINTERSLENLAAAFESFFMEHEDLRLHVEKDRLLYESETIYQVSPDSSSEDIITLLYRDGIKWIEFQDGLSREELAALYRVAYKYRLYAEETEGDIVTALTDEELEYIDFKAVDIFWQDELLMDFTKLPPPAEEFEGDGGRPEENKSEDTGGPEIDDSSAASIALVSKDHLELSNLDYVTLQQMVQEEENWVITEDLIEALLIILKSQSDKNKFEAILGFMEEQVVEIIEKDRFDLLTLLFRSLHKIFLQEAQEAADVQDWQRSFIKGFFKDLSTPETFRLISKRLLLLESIEIEDLKALTYTLLYFSPQLVPFLVPVVMKSSSDRIQQMISVAIALLSQRDLGPLEKAANKYGVEMGHKLLAILKRLEGDRVNRMLFRLCDHPSDLVRRKAIRELIGRDSKYAQRLFPLIDDPSKEIRTSILTAFGGQRSSGLEKMLLGYLKENTTKKDQEHIFACYETLGRCGSSASVPFLRSLLFEKAWNSFMGTGKLIFRECAASALALLDIPEAEKVLSEASESKFQVIRNAYDKARKINAAGRKKND